MIELLEERLRTQIASLIFLRSERAVALRYLCERVAGFSFPSEQFETAPDANVRLLRGINVGVGVTRWDDTVYWPMTDAAALQRFALRDSDIVIGMDRPLIQGGMRVATIASTDLPALLVQRVARLRANHRTSNGFLRYALMSDPFRAHFLPQTTGVSVPHISTDQIGSFRLPLPSRAEQEGIAAALRERETTTSETTRVLGRQVGLLSEHRQALITAAVTGDLDIPGVAA
jgi:type I restriction enzyme, S subunit